MNKLNYSTADINLKIAIISWDNTATHTSVHLDDLSVKGGGGSVLSNPFDENTIKVVQ
jgi:hypothetical protein